MIVTSSARAAALAASGESNNPFVAYDNLAAAGVASTTAGTEVAGSPAANALSGTTFDFWAAVEAAGVAMWQVVLPSAQSVGFASVAAHSLHLIGGAAVSIQYSTNAGVNWTTAGSATVPADGSAMCWRFVAVTAQRWRLRVTGIAIGLGLGGVAGVIHLGKELIIPERMQQGFRPAIQPTEVELQSNISEGAHLLGAAVVRRGSTLAYGFDLLHPDFARGAAFQAFVAHYNAGGGFFSGWRPLQWPGDFWYCWRSGAALAPVNGSVRGYMTAGLEMRVYNG